MITQRAMAVKSGGFNGETASGRFIYRHSNNKGSVLVFDMFGTTVNLFIADAKYRINNLKFGTYGKDASLTNFNQTNFNNTWYLNGTSSTMNTSQTSNPPVFTDAQLQAKWGASSGKTPNLSTDLTARQNCNVWMTYQGTTDSQSVSGVPAVAYARGLTTFEGITNGCDIPNEYELMVIFIEMNYIDMLDPTINSYRGFALGNKEGNGGKRWNFNGIGYAFSSTESGAYYVRGAGYSGSCSATYGKISSYGVIPVREL